MWCGHRQEFVTMPQRDGESWLLPILGEAA
jgi:hypothetical protein